MTEQSKRKTETREAVLCAARSLFIKHGYAHTTLLMIMSEAGVSKGGLYHHFSSKKQIFEIVFDQTSKQAIQLALKAVVLTNSPRENLFNTALAWLKQARKPETASILIEQGLQVLGWQRAREIEEVHSLGLITTALENAMRAGEINIVSPRITARLLNALLAEAALLSLKKPTDTRIQIETTLRKFLNALDDSIVDRGKQA